MFSLKRECIVFPTSRAIRFAASSIESGPLPRYMGMGEFLSRILIYPGKIVPDNDMRVMALHEASDFSTFSGLNIERNFFSFLQNSQYIFRFFEELAAEKVAIEILEEVDVYGDYEEHISILKHLREQYRIICEKHRWADPIFSELHARIDTAFLNHFDSVVIEIEGYLSRREIDILMQCSNVTELKIRYKTTPFNRKMTQRFTEMGFELEEGFDYLVNVSTGTVLSQEKLSGNPPIVCHQFHDRLSQAGFIKARIESFVRSGIAPEKIAVVLPDESFSTVLDTLNDEGNFNFAMGRRFEMTALYRQIEEVMLYFEDPGVLNHARLQNVSAQLFDWIKEHYGRNFEISMFEGLYDVAIGNEKAENDILAEEIRKMGPLEPFLVSMSFSNVLRLLMNRLKERSLDDVKGGKVTVMGLLETRGVEYEGVIVIDFNEGFVPHKSDKDLFLNSQTRAFAKLPTTYDRESLQKHYYTMLFRRAKTVALACVSNQEKVPSRFLLQMGIKTIQSPYAYEKLLFGSHVDRERNLEESSGFYDFKARPLSASALKSFLTCRYQFYLRYVKHVVPHEIPQDMVKERDIGNVLHSVLEKLYVSQQSYATPARIKEVFESILLATEEKDPLDRYMKRLWIEKLDPFYRFESERFEQGWKVAYREREATSLLEGIVLGGRIDRIDERDGTLQILDYKSGSFPDPERAPSEDDTDYQLSIYAVLAASLGKVDAAGYYDLSGGGIKFDRFSQERLERLKGILKELATQDQWEWNRTDDFKKCRYCDYALICSREAMRGV